MFDKVVTVCTAVICLFSGIKLISKISNFSNNVNKTDTIVSNAGKSNAEKLDALTKLM